MRKQAHSPQKDFTWGIKSTDIGFMRLHPGQTVLEGSSTATDCGCGAAHFTLKKAPQQPKPKTR